MKTLVFALAMVIPSLSFAAGTFETRCGWLANPTPANYWLTDKDGEWTISVQGGYQAKGAGDIAMDVDDQWVNTNVASYGYGCACADVIVNKRTRQVVEIKNIKQQLLKTCLQDQALPNAMSCK